MLSIFLLCCVNASQVSKKIGPEDVLLHIAHKRSKFSPQRKTTIEEAYRALGIGLGGIFKSSTASKNFDEVSCFKFHKQLFRGDKIIATIGRHAGRIYDQTQEKKGRSILLAWKNLASKQLTAPYPYTYKAIQKISQVYDFGEDDAGYFHICVLKKTAKNNSAKEPLKSAQKTSPPPAPKAPPRNSILGQMLEKDQSSQKIK